MRARLRSWFAVPIVVVLVIGCTSSAPSSDAVDASAGDSGGGFCRGCDFVVGDPMGFADPAMCPKNTCPLPPNGNAASCMLWCCVASPSASPLAYPCDLEDAAVDASSADAADDAPSGDADAMTD